MPTLHVRNVPEALYERIQEQAQTNQRSISAEVIVLLNRILSEAWRPQTEVLDSIRRRRFFRPVSPKTLIAPPFFVRIENDEE